MDRRAQTSTKQVVVWLIPLEQNGKSALVRSLQDQSPAEILNMTKIYHLFFGPLSSFPENFIKIHSSLFKLFCKQTDSETKENKVNKLSFMQGLSVLPALLL